MNNFHSTILINIKPNVLFYPMLVGSQPGFRKKEPISIKFKKLMKPKFSEQQLYDVQ